MGWDDERIAERKNEERKWGGEMESIKWDQYKRGEKICWVYAALDFLYYVLNGIGKVGVVNLCILLGQAVFLSFIYHGYSWAWYYRLVTGGILFAKGSIQLLILAWEWYWMIYAYSQSWIIITGLMSVIAVIQFPLLFIKMDMRYFSKIRGLARKGKLSEEVLEKVRKGNY